MAKLIIFDDQVRAFDLPTRAVVVGRSLKADVPLRDPVLSRKHCALVPESCGYRFVDLKSVNGSYVNGIRVDRTDLNYDDVIEVGSTVMVFLENDTRPRGDGVAALRNPVKAQELIQRVQARALSRGGKKTNGFTRKEHSSDFAADPSAETNERASQSERDFLEWAKSHASKSVVMRELLEDYLQHKIVSLLVRRVPELHETLSEGLDRVLALEHFKQDGSTLREAIRQAIVESFEAAGVAESASRLASGPEAREELGEDVDGQLDGQSAES